MRYRHLYIYCFFVTLFLIADYMNADRGMAEEKIPVLQARFLFSFGTEGEEPGQFRFPAGVSTDPNGNVYVADTGNNRIQKFNSKGKLLLFYGGFGWDSGQFQQPLGLSARNGLDVYVADYANRRIERYDKDLNWINSFYSDPAAEERLEFGFVNSVSTSLHGDLFLVDDENKRVVKLNAEFELEVSFGDFDWGEGALGDPARVFVSRDDYVFVSDSKEGRIVVFDYYGNYLYRIGENILKMPAGVVTSQDGLMLFVSDVAKHQIFVFDKEGRLISQIGSQGEKFGAFQNPRDLALYNNVLYVADTDNHRIQVFELSHLRKE